jgi:hypothetical protein
VSRLLSSCLSGEEARTIGEQQELDAEILAHYEEGVERERLLRGGAGRLEYLRTRELLARYLPPAQYSTSAEEQACTRCRWPGKATRCT